MQMILIIPLLLIVNNWTELGDGLRESFTESGRYRIKSQSSGPAGLLLRGY